MTQDEVAKPEALIELQYAGEFAVCLRLSADGAQADGAAQ